MHGINTNQHPHKTGCIDGIFHDVGVIEAGTKKIVIAGLTYELDDINDGKKL